MDILKESDHLIKQEGLNGKIYIFFRRDICMFSIEERDNYPIIEVTLYNGIKMIFGTATAPNLEKELERWIKEHK